MNGNGRSSATKRCENRAARDKTIPFIAHPQIRNRGTFGGSLAHADPAAELPAVALAANAKLKAKSKKGERWIESSDFFHGLFATALEPDELLTEITIPPMPPRTGWAFLEVARRHGDFALAGVACTVTLDGKGKCANARLVLMSLGDKPIDSQQATASLKGETPNTKAIDAAANAVDAEIDPQSDIHASAAFRRHLARVLTRRALETAVERAKGRD
jgi:CO/xanthine dehydrogenase FAD-binding subunit